MSRFLVHIYSGPADANKVTLGCLIALTAAEEGHDVSLFLAGDAVHLLAAEHLASLEGQGTGRLADHMAGLNEIGAAIYVSRMSAEARGYDENLLIGQNAEFALPPQLVALADAADTVLCY